MPSTSEINKLLHRACRIDPWEFRDTALIGRYEHRDQDHPCEDRVTTEFPRVSTIDRIISLSNSEPIRRP